MSHLTHSNLASLATWFDSTRHDVIGGVGILVGLFIIFVVVINIPDIIRTVKIHNM